MAIVWKQGHKPKLKRLPAQYRDGQVYKTRIEKAISALKKVTVLYL